MDHSRLYVMMMMMMNISNIQKYFVPCLHRPEQSTITNHEMWKTYDTMASKAQLTCERALQRLSSCNIWQTML